MIYYLEYVTYDSEVDDEVATVTSFRNKNELIRFLCELIPYGARVSTLKPKGLERRLGGR